MVTHKYQKALEQSKEFFGGDELAAQVFVDKYALRNNDKELLEATPADMFRRIAKELARIESQKFAKPFSEGEIFSWMDGFRYIIPQGGCLYGIGNRQQFVTLSNCYVVEPPQDSYGGIHYTDEQITQISKRRGGTGTCLDNLRPAQSPTLNSSRSSTGPISFGQRYINTANEFEPNVPDTMGRFSDSIREVGQDGRRGALMLMMSVHHPDIIPFIHIKHDKKKVTGANISVKASDKFMQSVVNNDVYLQQWPVNADSEHVKQMTALHAQSVWDELISEAWHSGEPGVLFWDTILRESVADCYKAFGFETVATNPCSELPLCILDSCRLLLLNLFSFVVHPFTKDAYFDVELFYKMAQVAQRLMDDIIDLEIECIERIIEKINADPEPFKYKEREREIWLTVREKCVKGRRTGTGITALGDTLAALGIKYDSPSAVIMTDTIFKTLKFGCYSSSVEMAKELGPFPVWNHEAEKDNPFLNRIKQERVTLHCCSPGLCEEWVDGQSLWDDMQKYGRRNIACLTCAPAGSISIECQTSSGIEPLLFVESTRRKKGNLTDDNFRADFVDDNGDSWMEFKVFHPKVQMWMNITGETDLTKSPWYGSCANDVDHKARIHVQAAAQKHIDHSISATFNLPANTTKEQIGDLIIYAWQQGCKGITVYREGSRDGVIIGVDKQKKRDIIVNRPRVVNCDVHHITVSGQQYFVLVGIVNGKPYEVFSGKNGFLPKKIKSGSIIRKRANFYIAKFDDTDVILSPITAACTETEEIISRLISLSMRYGADMHRVVQQLEKVAERFVDIQGFCRSLSRVLKKYIPDGTQEEGVNCPQCNAPNMVRQDGCVQCLSCGWSRCL